MQNNLSDLNNRLFEMMDRLGDDDLSENELRLLMKQSETMVKLSKSILNIASLQEKALVIAAEHGINQEEMPALIAVKDSREAIEEKGRLWQAITDGKSARKL